MTIKVAILVAALVGFLVHPFPASGEDENVGSTFQAMNMFRFGNPAALLPGAATLTRTDNGISFRVYTSQLTPPGAYTVWIVIFNKPENCTAGGPGRCMGPDLGNPHVQGSIVYGTGNIVGSDGIGNFHGSLAAGTPPAGIQVNVPAGTADGLKDSLRAEIHLVVRGHGAVSATGQAPKQLSTFEDGCTSCQDVQAVMFPPVK